MGEEHDERAPFQFFSDHIDPAIADATREGRKREFAAFTSFSGEQVPDPQDAATARRSVVSHGAADPSTASCSSCGAHCRGSSTSRPTAAS